MLIKNATAIFTNCYTLHHILCVRVVHILSDHMCCITTGGVAGSGATTIWTEGEQCHLTKIMKHEDII